MKYNALWLCLSILLQCSISASVVLPDGAGEDTLGENIMARVEGIGCPEYPKECLRKGHEGRVVVEVTILTTGENGGIKVVESSGCTPMEQSVLDFLRECRLIPERVLGRPVDSKLIIPFRFKILER